MDSNEVTETGVECVVFGTVQTSKWPGFGRVAISRASITCTPSAFTAIDGTEVVHTSRSIQVFRGPSLATIPGYLMILEDGERRAIAGMPGSTETLDERFEVFGYDAKVVHVPFLVALIQPLLWGYAQKRSFNLIENP
jgi:hypothetical protein